MYRVHPSPLASLSDETPSSSYSFETASSKASGTAAGSGLREPERWKTLKGWEAFDRQEVVTTDLFFWTNSKTCAAVDTCVTGTIKRPKSIKASAVLSSCLSSWVNVVSERNATLKSPWRPTSDRVSDNTGLWKLSHRCQRSLLL